MPRGTGVEIGSGLPYYIGAQELPSHTRADMGLEFSYIIGVQELPTPTRAKMGRVLDVSFMGEGLVVNGRGASSEWE